MLPQHIDLYRSIYSKIFLYLVYRYVKEASEKSGIYFTCSLHHIKVPCSFKTNAGFILSSGITCEARCRRGLILNGHGIDS